MKEELTGKNRNSRRGSSTLEILIAFAILILAITAGVVVAFGNQDLSVNTELGHQAAYRANRELENARASAAVDFTSVNSIASATSTMGEGAYNNIYAKSLDVFDISPCAKQVTSHITWQTDPLRPQQVALSTIITSTSTLDDLGGVGCSLTPLVDWTSPGRLGSTDLSGSQGSPATDVVAHNKIVFLTTTPSGHGKPDFFIVDATHPTTSLPILKSLEVNVADKGLNALALAGDYVYAANNEKSNQLQVIDLSNIASSTVVASSSMPGVTDAEGNAIFYYQSKIYLGTKKSSAGMEFRIYDVSDPHHPNPLGGVEIGADVNSIAVRGTTAYLATSDDSKELIEINLSTLSQIASANLSGTEDAKSLYLLGSRLYIGRSADSSQKDPTFYILNPASPSTPLGSIPYATLGDNVNDMRVNGSYAFVATSDSNDAFKIFNISTPGSITKINSGTCKFPQSPSGVDFENNVLYFSVQSNDTLRIIVPSLASCN